MPCTETVTDGVIHSSKFRLPKQKGGADDRDELRELVERWRPRYLWTSRKEKGRILNEFVALTGYHRKSAIRLL